MVFPKGYVRLKPMFTVYGLIDPRTMQIFYVGCTVNPAKRLRSHISAPHAKQLRQRIAEMAHQGFKPSMAVLEQTTDKTRERHWIDHCIFLGMALVNVCLPGGTGSVNLPWSTHSDRSETMRKVWTKRKAKNKAAREAKRAKRTLDAKRGPISID